MRLARHLTGTISTVAVLQRLSSRCAGLGVKSSWWTDCEGQGRRDKDAEKEAETVERQWQKEEARNTREGGRFRLGGEIFAGLAAYQFLALPAATPRRPGNQQLNGRHYLKVTHAHTHTLPTHQHKHSTQIRLYSNVPTMIGDVILPCCLNEMFSLQIQMSIPPATKHVHVNNLTSVVSSLVSLQMEAFTAQYAFIDYLGSSVERLTGDLCEYWLEKSAGLKWDSC